MVVASSQATQLSAQCAMYCGVCSAVQAAGRVRCAVRFSMYGCMLPCWDVQKRVCMLWGRGWGGGDPRFLS